MIEFHDHKIQTAYNYISMDRATAFFQAQNSDDATLLKKMHDKSVCSGTSHLVDLSRSSDDTPLPGVFFHANGDIEVDWRELFAALFAEEIHWYRIGGLPAKITG